MVSRNRAFASQDICYPPTSYPVCNTVLSNPHGHFYELKCESGTLRSPFPAGELREVPPEIALQYQAVIAMHGPRRTALLQRHQSLYVLAPCLLSAANTRNSAQKDDVAASKLVSHVQGGAMARVLAIVIIPQAYQHQKATPRAPQRPVSLFKMGEFDPSRSKTIC